MNKLPKISSYGNYDNSNYGNHTLMVDMGAFKLYYSYETIVAFESISGGLICSKNLWGTTTGKHLGCIQPDKKKRLNGSDFDRELKEMLSKHLILEGQKD